VVTVATVLLGMGVVTGMSGLVVDVGQIYAEREQLQTGSDAAALALARNCALNPAHCADQADLAARYANVNASDGSSAVTLICGTAMGLSACGPQTNGLTACLGSVPAGVPYVEVRTGTMLPNGSTLLPPAFAAAMLGNGGYRGRQILACARAGWGAPYTATTASVTTSQCDWNQLTSNGSVLPPPPSVATPQAGYEGVLYLKGDTNSTCTLTGGMTAPGGFSWLDDPTGACQTTVSLDHPLTGSDPGNNASQACQAALTMIRSARGTLLIPLYNSYSSQGQNAVYTVAGVSAFVLTGYHLSGFSATSWLTGHDPCTGNERCLYGYFASEVVTGHGSLGGTNFGANIVTVIG